MPSTDRATPHAQPTPKGTNRFIYGAWRRWRQRVAFWVGALLVGLIALAFAWLADHAYALFELITEHYHWAPLLITPTGFALLAWLSHRWFRQARGSGIPQVIAALESPNRSFRRQVLSVPVAAARMILTVGALMVGGSVGREGPTVHVGAAIIYAFGTKLGLHGRRTVSGLILAGGAAGIAAAFNTPLAGIVFAIEELSRTFEQRFSGLLLTAVVIGGMVTLGLMGHYSYFGEIGAPLPQGWQWAAVPVLGVLGGLLGGLYVRLVLPTDRGWLGKLCEVRTRWPVRFAAACGMTLALLGLVSGNHVFGTGYEETRRLLEGQPVTDQIFLLWKFLANVVSYLAGIPGGLFSPSLSVGASLSPMLSFIPGFDVQTGALLGMGAYLGGVTRSPLTGSVIVLELSHSPDLAIPLLASGLIASSVSGWIAPVSLYHALAQNIAKLLTSSPIPR